MLPRNGSACTHRNDVESIEIALGFLGFVYTKCGADSRCPSRLNIVGRPANCAHNTALFMRCKSLNNTT